MFVSICSCVSPSVPLRSAFTSAPGQALATWSDGDHITHDIYRSLIEEGWEPEQIASMQNLHYRPTQHDDDWPDVADETASWRKDDVVAVRGIN